MPIDVVDKIELFMELFEPHAERMAGNAPPSREAASYFSMPLPESRAETITLAMMRAPAATLLGGLEHAWLGKEDRADVPVGRIARYLAENAAAIDQDAPRSPRLLHYVYPVI